MSTNGSNLRSNTAEPTSNWLNNWVLVIYKNGRQKVHIMSIYDYKKIKRHIALRVQKRIAQVHLIRPKNERHYLLINTLDERQLQAFEQRLLNNEN